MDLPSLRDLRTSLADNFDMETLIGNFVTEMLAQHPTCTNGKLCLDGLILAACGYNSGRGVSGVDDTKVFAETIPPADPYATRTPPNPKQGTTDATIEGYVTAAEQHGGGWVQLVFHHICNSCDAYSITATNFQALLDWLQGSATNGVVVETTAQVIGGPVNPPVPA